MGRLLLALALALGLAGTAAAENGSHILLLNLDLAFETPADRNAAVDRTIAVVRDRVAALIDAEPAVWRYADGDTLILLGVPDTADVERVKSVATRAGRLDLRLVDDSVPMSDAVAGRLPPDRQLLLAPAGSFELYYVVENLVWVSGASLVDAHAAFDQIAQPVVSFRFDDTGRDALAEATRDHVGRRLAIVLDGEVVSAPVIREPILGGEGQISGAFTADEATDLATLLRSGALPGPLSLVKQHWIAGPPPTQPTTILQ